MLKFNATREDLDWITQIVDRALENKSLASKTDFISLSMDIELVHCRDIRLNLQGLFEADNFNFFHDIIGIHNNLNRSTGELDNCFLPRFVIMK